MNNQPEPMSKLVQSMRTTMSYLAADVVASAVDAGIIDAETAGAIITHGIVAVHTSERPTLDLHPHVDRMLAAMDAK